MSCLYITRYFFFISIDEIEHMQLSRASQQAQSLITKLSTDVEARSFDWAYWDETNELLVNGDSRSYREKNLSQGGLNELNLDLMIFVDSRQIVIEAITRDSKKYDTVLVSQLMLSEGVQQHFKNMTAVLDSNKRSKSGLLLLNGQIWNVSVAPVRDSEGTSISSGWLIWGQNLSSRFPGKYDSILIAENAITLNDRAETIDQVVKTKNTMTLWSELIDISGHSIANITTTIERHYFKKGNILFNYLFIAVVVAAVIISIVTAFLFRRRVAVRFSDLERDINQLLSSYQFAGVSSSNKDELDRLSTLIQAVASDNSITQERLQDTQQKLDALYQSQTMGVLLIRDRVIIDINNTALSMLDYLQEEILNKPLDMLCPDDDPNECHIDFLYHQFNLGETQFEGKLLTSQGHEIDCHIEISVIQYQGGDVMMLAVSDVREKREQAKLIESLVERDHLSGLWNRKAIIEKASCLEANNYTLLYISMPNLHLIAEIYGHEQYDEAIRFVAAQFGSKLTEYLVGRISAYEFIALVPNLDNVEDARRGATKLLEEFSEKQTINGIEIDLKCEISMIDPEISDNELNSLLQAASYTIQNGKTDKRTHVLRVTRNMFERSQAASRINRDILSAVRDGSIHAHYQAIVDANSGEIKGFEALARWQHPELGFVSPEVFIPLAEKSDLIVELGEKILSQSCQFIEKVNATYSNSAGNSFSIHVNLSAPHFYHIHLSSFLQELVAKYHIQPGQLVIEITESMLMGIEDEIISLMEELKSFGILFALDDFGTGYSSFSTLCSFPLDIVKLDKSYIDQLETNDRAKSLVKNIAKMAQELGLTTVAEGVETASQVRKLCSWNIEEIQGYHFYRPMPESKIMDIL
ncbi:EAL domain-containing protein [Vibrio sp. 99-8-1]|uniref:bifunctional diguanylate cyclase/phosphodiesterase n=1 Tax=Vibrio sp. 99-8-1 TaxID=2607602 RepID=UPI0031F30CED